MKRIIVALALTLSANAFAECTAPVTSSPAGECSKLAAFKGNQDRKLLLSRFSLGLIKVDQYDALYKASAESEKAAIAQCYAK